MTLEKKINAILFETPGPIGFEPVEDWVWTEGSAGEWWRKNYHSMVNYSEQMHILNTLTMVESLIESAEAGEALTSPSEYIREYYKYIRRVHEQDNNQV